MKITSILQKNAMAIVAMATIVGFSAFKIGSEAQQSNRYEVNNGQIVSSTPLETPPSDDPTADCSTQKTANMCAIQIELEDGQPFPSTVAEAEANHNVLDEAYRD